MISAGDQVKKLKAYLPGAVCETYIYETKPAEKAEAAKCNKAIPAAVDNALKLYPLTTDAQRTIFANIVRRYTVSSVVFRTQVPFVGDGLFTGAEMEQAQAIHRQFVLNPKALVSTAPKVKGLINIYSFADKTLYKRVTYKKMIEIAAMMASKVKQDGGIVIPPALMTEINMINKIFPKKWATHLIERVARMYLTTVKELDIGGAHPKVVDYEDAAKKVVTRVRRMAYAAIKNEKDITKTPKVINTADAKKQYTKIAKAEKKAPSIKRMFVDFMWAMTNTFVVRADQVQKTGVAAKAKPKAKDYKKDAAGKIPAMEVAKAAGRTGLKESRFLGGEKATEYKKALAEWVKTKTIKITFRRAPIRTLIENGHAKGLRRKSATIPPKSKFRLFEKIKIADTVRGQAVKALKGFLVKELGLVTASGDYNANRTALAKEARIGRVTGATVEGMNKFFDGHYGAMKADGTSPKTSASPMAIRDLEAVGIKMKGNKPEFVMFKISLLKSTSGAPQITVVDPIVNGGTGNRTLRFAVAVRRHMAGMELFEKKFKGEKPEVRATKLATMQASLVKELAKKDLDTLLLSSVVGIKDDGSLVFKYADPIFLKYEKTGWLAKQLKQLEGLANVKRPEANGSADGIVDLVDRSKVLFGDIVKEHKSRLSTGGSLDPKKVQALRKALVHWVRVSQNKKKMGLTGSRYIYTGKGATFDINATKIKTRPLVPAKDSRGRVRKHKSGPKKGQTIFKYGRPVEKDGFKVTNLKLKKGAGDGSGGGGDVAKGILWKKKFASGLEVSVGGGIMAMYLRSFTNQTDEKNSGAGFANFNVNMKYKKFSAGFSAGIAGLKFEHQDATYDPEKPIIHAPHQSVGGFQDVGGMISANVGFAITKKVKISAKGGLIGSKPDGFRDRPFKLDMHTGSLPYLAPILLGAGAQLSLAGARYSAGVFLRGGKPTIPSFTAKAAWSDGMQIGAGAHGRFHITKNFAISAAYGFGMQKGGKKMGADGALKLTPLSQHSLMAGLNVNLVKKRLMLDLAYRGVFQSADQETGLQTAGEHTVSLSALMLISKNFAIYGSGSYTRRSDKILWPSSGNTINPGALNSEIVKEGPGWTLGASFYTSSNTWLSAFYTGGRIVNRDIEGLKAHHAFGALFGWAFDGHKAYQSGN